MPLEALDVAVSGSGGAPVRSMLRSVGSSAADADRQVGGLGSALGGLRDDAISTASDSQVLGNRLNAIGNEMGDVRSSAGQAAGGLGSFSRSAVSAATNSRTLQGRVARVQNELSSVSRSAESAEGSISDVGSSSTTAAAQSQLLAGRLDNLDGELGQTSRGATNASGSMTTLAGTTGTAAGSASTAAGSFGALQFVMSASLIPSIGNLVSAFVPLAGTLTGVAGAAGSLGGAFTAVLGTGALAYGQELTGQYAQQRKEVQRNIQELESLRESSGGLTAQQQRELQTLKNKERELSNATTAAGALGMRMSELRSEVVSILIPMGEEFVPLIRDAFNAVPQLTRNIVNATGDLTPFASALRDAGQAAFQIIPNLVDMAMTIARDVLPQARAFATYLMSNAGPAIDTIRSTTSRFVPMLVDLGKAVVNLLGPLNRFGSTALSLILPALTDVTDALTGALQWFNDLDPQIRRVASAVTLIAPPVFAASRALSFFSGGSSIISTITSIAGAFTSAGGAASVLGGALSTLATGGAIAAVGALAAAVASNMGGIRDALVQVGNALYSELLPTFRAAEAVLVPIITDIAQSFGLTETNAEGAFSTIATLLTGTLVPTIRSAGTTIRSVLLQMGSWWQANGDRVTRVISNIVGGVSDLISGMGSTETTLLALAPVLLSLVGTFGSFSGAVGTIVSTAGTAGSILGTLASVGSSLGATFVTVAARAGGLVTSAVNLVRRFGGLVGTVRTVGGVLGQLAGTAIWGVITRIGSLVTKAGNLGRILGQLAGGAIWRTITTIGSLATRFSGIISTIGSFSFSLSGIIGTVSSVIGTVTSFGGSLGGLVATISSSAVPALTTIASVVGSVALPLGAVAAAAVALYGAWETNFLGIRDTTMRIFNAIKAALNGDTSQLQNMFQGALSRIQTIWREDIQPIIAQAERLGRRVKKIIGDAMDWLWKNGVQPALRGATQLWQEHGDEIVSELRQTFEVARSRIMTFWSWIEPFFNAGTSRLMGFWNKWGDEIQAVTKFVFDTVGSVIGGAIDGLITTFLVILDFWQGDFESGLNRMKNQFLSTFSGIWNWLKKWVGGFVNWIDTNLLGGIIDKFLGFVNRIIGNSIIPEMFVSLKNYIASTGKNLLNTAFQTAIDAAKAVVDGLVNWMTGASGRIGRMFSSVRDYIVTTGTNLIDNSINTVVQGWKNIFNQLAAWATGASGWIGQMFTDIRTYIFGTAAGQVERAVSNVRTKVEDVFTGLATWLVGSAGWAVTTWFDFRDYILNTAVGLIKGAVQTVVDGWMTIFNGLYENATAVVEDMFEFINQYIHSDAESMISGAFWQVADGIRSAFGDALDGIVSTLQSTLSAVLREVEDAIETVEDVANIEIGIEVPDADDVLEDAADEIDDFLGGGGDNPNDSGGGDDSGGGGGGSGYDGPYVGGDGLTGLAKGGFVDEAMPAVVGEGRHNEAVVPLHPGGGGPLGAAVETAMREIVSDETVDTGDVDRGTGGDAITVNVMQPEGASRSDGRAFGEATAQAHLDAVRASGGVAGR